MSFKRMKGWFGGLLGFFSFFNMDQSGLGDLLIFMCNLPKRRKRCPARHWAFLTPILLRDFCRPAQDPAVPSTRLQALGETPPPQGCSTHSFYHPAPPPCLQPEQRCAHLLAEYWESWEGWWGCNWWGCLGVNWQAVVSGEPSSLASSGTSTLVIMNPSLDFSLIVTPDTCKWAFFFPLWLVVFYCNIVS